MGEFHMVVEKGPYSKKMATRVKVDDQEFDVKFYFLVSLKSTARDMKAAGQLDVIKDGNETLSGKFGDSANDQFSTLFDFRLNSALKYLDYVGKWRDGRGFYTTGSTCLLTLVARITIPGRLISLGGSAEEEMKQNRMLDFQPLLADPKHSDIVLKCGDTTFHCHKVILAASSVVFDRMLDQNMQEAQMGEVDIFDVDPDTLKQMLEFIYTEQVEDETYTAELLYAADKYELGELVKLCARHFRAEVTPENAADILLLAERRSW